MSNIIIICANKKCGEIIPSGKYCKNCSTAAGRKKLAEEQEALEQERLNKSNG